MQQFDEDSDDEDGKGKKSPKKKIAPKPAQLTAAQKRKETMALNAALRTQQSLLASLKRVPKFEFGSSYPTPATMTNQIDVERRLVGDPMGWTGRRIRVLVGACKVECGVIHKVSERSE